MNVNPMKLMALKTEYAKFQKRHPKIVPFFQAVSQNALKENTVIEIQVSTEDGKQYASNMKITPEDIRMFQELKSSLQE